MARNQRPLLYVVGADSLLLDALAADLPDPRVRRFSSFAAPLPASAADPPDLVLIGSEVVRAEVERLAARRWWGARPVVVEVIAGRPLALLWLGAETVRVVEMAPGFLAPFLLPVLEEPHSTIHWRPVRGWARLAHAGASLVIMAVLTSVALGGWTRTHDSPSTETPAMTGTVATDSPPGPFIAEPACPDGDPC